MLSGIPPPPPRSYEMASEAALPSRTTYGMAHGAQVRWGAAFGLGLLAAVVGGTIWGFILAATGYIFAMAAVVIGLAVGAAVRKGAGRITSGLIVLAGFLTVFGVFLGDVIGIWVALLQAGYDVTIFDVIAAYPRIVAIAPSDTALSYFFALLGVVATVGMLYSEMKGIRRPRYGPGPAMPGAPGGVVTSTNAQVETTARSATRAGARVVIAGSPHHTVDATFESTFGTATVLLDGQRYEKVRVWGVQKIVDVTISGPPAHSVRLRFRGTFVPRIDVSVDGALLTTI